MRPKTHDADALTRRVQELERQNRRQRVTGTLLLIMVGSFLILGAAKAREPKGKLRMLEAEEFVLVDRAGEVLARLTGEKNVPSLIFYGATGRPRAGLGLAEGTPRLDFFDEKGRPRVWLGVSEEGMAAMTLFDARGRIRKALGVLPNGDSRLELRDAEGKASAVLSIQQEEKDGPVLELDDGKRHKRITAKSRK